MSRVGQKIFWGAYWKIYKNLCGVRPYIKTVDQGIKLLKLESGDKYLDLACGPGITTKSILDKNKDVLVVGTDYSKSGLKIAQKDNPKIPFFVADFNQALPFKSESLDGVFANNALYLARNPLETLADIHRVLKPGSVFVMSNPRDGAKPGAILKEHLRMSYQANKEYWGRVPSTFIGLFSTLYAVGVFCLFLPFQVALKNKAGGAANFWSQSKWQKTLISLAARGHEFETVAIEPAYADQNITFALRKV